MTVTANPYLLGNYGPVPDEITTTDLEVAAIPRELRGRYVRIGPNPYRMPEGPYHWFTGDGMVHGVELRDGRATWYRNRWVRTHAIATAMGEEPVGGPAPPMYDSSNTNVLGFAGRILALTESAMPYELSPQLDTRRRFDFGGPLPTGFTAHPKVDPVTGELHAFAYWFAEPYLTYHVIDPNGVLVRSEPITLPRSVMMHDFAITRSHVVFFDTPVVFDLGVRPFPFRWEPEHATRIGVMPRDGADADVHWIEIEQCTLFHPMNAYDDGSAIVVDLPRHASFMEHDPGGPIGGADVTLRRWTIDLTSGKVRDELVDDRAQEFPRVNETLLASKHRYGYAAGFANTECFKHDFERGTTEVHAFGAGREPGELVFVPAAGATAEDDGWLMGFVYDAATDRSDFVVLDAADITSAPVATVKLPRRVPFGFHGNWIPD